MADRHPATTGLVRWFEYDHLPDDLKRVSEVFATTAAVLLKMLPDGPELTTSLRKLLEAKDCAVRAAIEARAVPLAR